MAVAIVLIAMQWLNSRITMLRANQSPAHPSIYDTYPYYHSMAKGFREGRIGQVDLPAVQRYSAVKSLTGAYDPLPPEAPHQWVNYYTLDIGYSLLVEVARLAFPVLPDNHLRSLALQLVADAALVVFMIFVFSHWNLWLGLAAAGLYSMNFVFRFLVSLAFYYYWDIPLTFVVLGSLILAFNRPAEVTRWLTIAGITLGFGVWLRGSWWPLSLFLLAVALSSPFLRKRLAVPIVAFAILAIPQVVRSSLARGELTFSTRTIWHVALVGLGYYPNRYGLELKDNVVFKLTHDKYGVEFNPADYSVHDQAAKKEFLAIWRSDRRFVLRSFWGRLQDSVTGSAESPSYSFVSNVSYRLLCLAGFVLMLLRGGDKRVIALAAGGTYAIYVGLTSVFYYVGLPYDSVSQVTLLILFTGGAEAVLSATLSASRRLAGRDERLVSAIG